MPRVIFINPDGSRIEADVPVGESLMESAKNNGVEGIVADCAGGMSCATCHVYVEEGADLFPPPDPATEEQMLEFTAVPRAPNSRLSCQLIMGKDMAGVVLRVADRQF